MEAAPYDKTPGNRFAQNLNIGFAAPNSADGLEKQLAAIIKAAGLCRPWQRCQICCQFHCVTDMGQNMFTGNLDQHAARALNFQQTCGFSDFEVQ